MPRCGSNRAAQGGHAVALLDICSLLSSQQTRVNNKPGSTPSHLQAIHPGDATLSATAIVASACMFLSETAAAEVIRSCMAPLEVIRQYLVRTLFYGAHGTPRAAEGRGDACLGDEYIAHGMKYEVQMEPLAQNPRVPLPPYLSLPFPPFPFPSPSASSTAGARSRTVLWNMILSDGCDSKTIIANGGVHRSSSLQQSDPRCWPAFLSVCSAASHAYNSSLEPLFSVLWSLPPLLSPPICKADSTAGASFRRRSGSRWSWATRRPAVCRKAMSWVTAYLSSNNRSTGTPRPQKATAVGRPRSSRPVGTIIWCHTEPKSAKSSGAGSEVEQSQPSGWFFEWHYYQYMQMACSGSPWKQPRG